MSDLCDTASAGIVVRDERGRVLLLTRATAPAGVAPAAGHVFDGHEVLRDDGSVDVEASFRAAAVAELAEELGLSVSPEALTEVTGGWRPSPCRRALPPRAEAGHEWRVYAAAAAEVSGVLTPSPDEASGARWYPADEVQALAERTGAQAAGLVSDAEFAADPGIQAVWVRWLADAGVVSVSPDVLAAIDRMLLHQARTCR
ncbi:NUDIX domain-containing protein [Actinocorallia sp. A-T 12471]|uniref:NUDIX domain-containing protein n=1 Tax=Actinocorallia sp. A-T 12471 TaxID=3089813 RepID=UPI0029CDE128|nr:NUDIX domain-containing protein [Actinocorallia sp. A-T 12471]MDX6740044.1 NUDIX domain-containing protein [Actinocorallia sp. A-T 12471]